MSASNTTFGGNLTLDYVLFAACAEIVEHNFDVHESPIKYDIFYHCNQRLLEFGLHENACVLRSVTPGVPFVVCLSLLTSHLLLLLPMAICPSFKFLSSILQVKVIEPGDENVSI